MHWIIATCYLSLAAATLFHAPQEIKGALYMTLALAALWG